MFFNPFRRMPIFHTKRVTRYLDLSKIQASSGKNLCDLRPHEIVEWICWVKAIQPEVLVDSQTA